MEFSQKIVGIKNKQKSQKKVITTNFKKIKDAHNRLNKSYSIVDSLKKVSNQVESALVLCSKKTCEDHHTKVYEKTLSLYKKTLEELQQIKDSIIYLQSQLNKQEDSLQHLTSGLLTSQHKLLTRNVKEICKNISIYKQDPISKEDDSPFNTQGDYIISDS